jgi:hypothetical protein
MIKASSGDLLHRTVRAVIQRIVQKKIDPLSRAANAGHVR